MTKPSDQNDLAGYLREPIEQNQNDIALLKLQVQEIQDYLVNLTKALLEEKTDEQSSDS